MTKTLQGVTQSSGLAGWVLRALKQRGAQRQERSLRVVESLALGGRKQLHLVSCAGKTFLVGSGADAVQCIVAVDGTCGIDVVQA